MKDGMGRALSRLQGSFSAFTTGQKLVAVVGVGALLLAGFMVFRWAAAPSYAPLFSNLASEDAAAVVEQLEADGIPYEVTGGGGTIMVPRADVYTTRISLSGEGLPSNSGEGGYAILDGQDISTSQFKEQTDFKRAMEGELAATIEALDGVDTAVVHLALPPKQVFADEQEPATASVLVATRPGAELAPEQVQAVVHLVASSIDGLDPEKVTVADSSGTVLSTPGEDGSGVASTRAQQVTDFQDEMGGKIQTMLDQVLGPGNSQVQVTANLDFDKSVTRSTTYADEEGPALSSSQSSETYSGDPNAAGAGGVVGPDGQMETDAGNGAGSYQNSSETSDNGVDTVVEERETAPGGVESLHTAVVIDSNAPVKLNALDIQDLVTAAVGIDTERGDTVQVSALPFDTGVEDANAAALKEAADAEAAAQRMQWIRDGALALLVLLLLLGVWLRGRKRAKQRQDATTYVVEQLRNDQAERAAIAAAAKHRLEPSPATMALQQVERDGQEEMRDELAALVERQPAEVAAVLRGWLVERS